MPLPMTLYVDLKPTFNPAEDVLTATSAPSGPIPAGWRRVKVQFIVGAGITRQVDATNVKMLDVETDEPETVPAPTAPKRRGRPPKPKPLAVPERGVVPVPVEVLRATPRPPSEAKHIYSDEGPVKGASHQPTEEAKNIKAQRLAGLSKG